MLNQDDFAVYEVLVYILEISEAGVLYVSPPPGSLSFLETGMEHIVQMLIMR